MVFLSYSWHDTSATTAVYEFLRLNSLMCWLDKPNIPVGQAFVEELGKGLHRSDCLILVDTSHSRGSYWVSRELEAALRYRKEGRYHSLIRLYSSDCAKEQSDVWDLSLPLEEASLHDVVACIKANTISEDLNAAANTDSVLTGGTSYGQPAHWIGRQETLYELDQWWHGRSPSIWISGLGGSGKSGLIRTWATALSCLGYLEGTPSVFYMHGRDLTVSELQSRVSARTTMADNWNLFFVLDGYDEVDEIEQMDAVIEQAVNLNIRVAVTSRTAVPHKLKKLFRAFALSSMSEGESSRFLEEHGITGAESKHLASQVDHHPLALVLLASYASTGNFSASDVLRNLHATADKLHATTENNFSSAACSISALLSEVINKLTDVARATLKTLCKRKIDDLRDVSIPALRELAGAALIQVDHLDVPRGVVIHPLVRTFVTDHL